MTQSDWLPHFAFSALGAASRATVKEPAWHKVKGQNPVSSALLYSHLVGARVARQRCPILQPGRMSLSPYQPYAKGTSLLCRIGDISTLP